jgi:membrane protein YqaA with SNARE-associated domain
MGKYHLPHWLQAAVAASGGSGIFLLAFLDATFMPFPSINDLLLIDLSVQTPSKMPYYAAMSALGSILGGILLFMIARKGEEAAFHRRGGRHSHKIRKWVERNGFVSLLIAALLPPPMPLRVFVLAAGLLGMPLRTFVVALTIARTIRFFGEGYLAIRYGNRATSYLVTHKVGFSIVSLLSVLLLYVLYRALFRPPAEEQAS